MKNKLVRIVAALAAIACLGTAACFAGLIWSTEREYQKGDEAYDALAELVKEDPGESPGASGTDDNNKDIADSGTSKNAEDEESTQEINLDLAKQLNNDITA